MSASPSSSSRQGTLQNLKVVVVDDDDDARTLAAFVLRMAGARVFEADNAADAFELVRGDAPDVIVSDLAMPHEDGYSLMRRIRAVNNSIGAVALSAFSGPEDRRRSFEAGFDIHLSKSGTTDALVNAVHAVVAPTAPYGRDATRSTHR